MRGGAAEAADMDNGADWPPQRYRASRSDVLDRERQRFFLWSPVALGAGIASYFALASEPPLWLALVPLLAMLIIRPLVPRGTLVAAIANAVLLASLGFALAKGRVEWVRAPVLEKTMRSAEILGTVSRVEPRPPRGARVTIDVIEIRGLPSDRTPLSLRVRILANDAKLQAGDRIRLSASLSPPAKPSIPGGFDFARTAWFEGLGAVGYAYKRPIVEPRGPPQSWSEWWSRGVSQSRQAITARIHAVLPGETGAIAAALITGERGGITAETNDAYRGSGLFHILSISGLHMVIMAGAVFFSVRLLLAAVPAFALRFQIKKWAAVAGMCAALGYLAISGGAFATVRSALMILVIFSAVLLDRPALALRNVALSAIVILAIFPESLFDAGFQMSFAAVTGLVATYEEVRRRMGRRNEPHPVLKVLMFFGGIVFSTLIASIAVAPFAAYHFHQSQQYAVLANLVAIPICNIVVMPMALAALVLMTIGLEALALVPMGWGIDAMTWCATGVANLPGAVGHLPAIPLHAFVFMVLGGLWLALWQTRLRMAGALLVLAGLALAPFMPRADILIARNGELVALRGADGRLSALPARQSKYEMERWLEYDGDARSAAEVQQAAAFTCDGVGCIADVKGARVAVARNPAAIADDCRQARIIILNDPRPRTCQTTGLVVDVFDVWREGTHAIYVEPAITSDAPTLDRSASGREQNTLHLAAPPRLRIDTVAAHRGDRPWAPRIISPRQQPHKLPRPHIADAPKQNDAQANSPEQTAETEIIRDIPAATPRGHSDDEDMPEADLDLTPP